MRKKKPNKTPKLDDLMTVMEVMVEMWNWPRIALIVGPENARRFINAFRAAYEERYGITAPGPKKPVTADAMWKAVFGTSAAPEDKKKLSEWVNRVVNTGTVLKV